MRVLAIGYGNPSRMDDGAGHWLINRLNAQWGLPTVGLLGEPDDATARVGEHTVRTVWVQQLDMGLAEEAAQADRVVFLDAHVEGEPVVVCDVTGDIQFGVTSHVLTPDTVVELADRLFGHRPAAWRCSVRGERFDFGATLSPEVEARCAGLADRLGEALLSEIGPSVLVTEPAGA
jgi:hydrogenase maturation protease